MDYQGGASLSQGYNLGSHSSTFEMGFEIRNAHKNQNENDQFFDANGSYPMNQFLSGASNPNYYGGSFAFGPLTNYSKIESAIASGLTNGGFTPNVDKDHIVSDPATWSAQEGVYAGYLMDAITIGKLRLEGGLRIEGTTENFNANRVTLDNGAYSRTDPVTGSFSYVNLMPSVQAQYLIAKDINLRLSYGRGLSRPNFQDIVPAVQADPNSSPKSLQVGNPALLPTKANNYDVLIEHYFQPLGILQGASFTNP